MTNLSLNDNYINNPRHIHSGLGTVNNKVEILNKIKPAFFQYFEQAVDDLCRRLDVEFGLQLNKNREKVSKEQYVKFLEYIRSVRKEIKLSYLSGVNDGFNDDYRSAGDNQGGQLDISKVSLISGDAVKENHAITQIIRQCESSFYEELASLNKRLFVQSRKQIIADSQNPIFPEKLVRALVEVVNPLKLNADAKVALYKAFEANVFEQLGFIYRELIKSCESLNSAQLYVVDEIKEQVDPTSVSSEQPSAEFELLRKKLELWRLAHFPSSYDLTPVSGNNVFYEHFEIKNALQLLQQFDDDLEPNEKKQPIKWQVLKKLKELSFNDKGKDLVRYDEDVLDLVALIFSEIERDESLEDSVKAAILQLEIPFSAVSLGRYSVFINQDNPVRQLLDELFTAGMCLNKDGHDDRLIHERMASSVKKLTQYYGFEFLGWKAEANQFSSYRNKQKQLARHTEEDARQFMINKQAEESDTRIIFAAIENSIMGKTLPASIVEFLRNVWSDVLLDAYSHKDEQPEQWEKSVTAMDELIMSVMPPANDLERKQILKLLPGLIAELRKGLKQISYDKPAQSRFFKDLAVWHIILMDKNGKTTGDRITVEDKKIIMDDSSEQAENLAEQSWVAFISESGRQWGKLLWKNTETMLFVGKNGAKIFEMQTDELAKKLRLGQAAIVRISEKTPTDRVLSELMSL